MSAILRQPDPEQVTPLKAAAVLRRLGFDWATAPNFLPWPLPPVVPLRRVDAKDWWVGEGAMVTYLGPSDDFPVSSSWSCDRDARGDGKTWEIAAAVIVHCWNMPRWRHLFDLPEWALDLEGLADTPLNGSAELGRMGWVRYRLTETDNPIYGVPLERDLIRTSAQTGRPLRPRPVAQDIEALDADLVGIEPVDRAIHDLLSTLRSLNRSTLNHSIPKIEEVRARLRNQVFQHLLSVSEVWFGSQRLTMNKQPVTPVLHATDRDETIELGWSPEVHHVFDAGSGYVITADFVLRPVAPSGLSNHVEKLLEPLPQIPAQDAAIFLERFVVKSSTPMELGSRHLPPMAHPERIEGCLMLSEEDEALRIDVRFIYAVAGAEREVEAENAVCNFNIGERLVRRVPERERALIAEARSALGVPLPAHLQAESAYQVLSVGIPSLPSYWKLLGEDSLNRYRVTGSLSPKVHVPSGIDWLDLKIEFTHGDQVIDSADVIKSWRSGQRFYRLDDGTLAKLPTEWLKRHGSLGEEIEALRTANRGRLPRFAAPMVEGLLDEADGDVSGWSAQLNKLSDLEDVPDRSVPNGVVADLRAYQVVGFRWLCWLRDLGFGGVLADDMGLGKTVQALTLLSEVHRNSSQPSLVVAPTSVIYAWEEEAHKFVPDLRVHVHHGPRRPKKPPEEIDLVVTSYSLLRSDADAFDREWTTLILDEAQRIKNPSSHVAQVARSLHAQHRFALTGTPLENRLLELWSIFECLMPGFFGSRTNFQQRYALPVERDRDITAVEALRKRIRPFVLRRLKTEVATELPPRQEKILYCELGPAQRQLYERVKNTYRQTVLERVDSMGMRQSTLPVLEALMRLRQACCDPGLLPFPEALELQESAKLDLLIETLDETIASGHRTLVFSQWTSLLQRVIPRLDQRGWTFLYLDGKTVHRQQLVQQWNDPSGPPVFLISLKAGGAGLNLTGADHVIHLDPWWNPAVEAQATDRAHRIGQDRPVVSYKLVARDTIEEKVLALQELKRDLFDTTIDQDRFRVEQLTRDDLEAFFRSDQPDVGRFDVDEKKARVEGDDAESVDGVLGTAIRITATELRDKTGWTPDEARDWLKVQVRAGHLEKRGQKRGTYYVRP